MGPRPAAELVARVKNSNTRSTMMALDGLRAFDRRPHAGLAWTGLEKSGQNIRLWPSSPRPENFALFLSFQLRIVEGGVPSVALSFYPPITSSPFLSPSTPPPLSISPVDLHSTSKLVLPIDNL